MSTCRRKERETLETTCAKRENSPRPLFAMKWCFIYLLAVHEGLQEEQTNDTESSNKARADDSRWERSSVGGLRCGRGVGATASTSRSGGERRRLDGVGGVAAAGRLSADSARRLGRDDLGDSGLGGSSLSGSVGRVELRQDGLDVGGKRLVPLRCVAGRERRDDLGLKGRRIGSGEGEG